MNTFKKKSLYAALAGASALGVTGAAQAVNVNADGLGQVLIYPYYTTQDKVLGIAPYTSLLSVVNSTASVKAVKVRFLEGRNSQEVLDFNLFLSPRDVWTAAVLPMPHIVGDLTYGAGIATYDKSCTVPVVSGDAKAPSPFLNYLFSGDADDYAGTSLERTREGYVEIIEMGVPTDAGLVKSITHVNGVPPCTGLADLGVGTTVSMGAPSGGLFGGMTLINVLAGEDYTEDAIALENFRTTGKYDLPGAVKPDLSDVSTNAVVVGGSASAVIVESQIGARSIDMISALFMHDHVYNEFVLDTGTKSGTDWVVTMPTKRYYYTRNTTSTTISYNVEKLFQRNFTADGACDDIALSLYDREEAVVKTDVGFSPPKPGAKANTLCWEANVMTFNATNVLGSKNNRNIVTTYQNGWGDLAFTRIGPQVHELTLPNTTITSLSGARTTGTATYIGLPVVGFAAISFQNGTLSGGTGVSGLIQSNYGGNFVHKTKRTVGF